MPELIEQNYLRYEVVAWVDSGYSETVRETIERALEAEVHVSDFGVDPGEDASP